MKIIKLSFILMLFLSGASAFSASRDYTPVFKRPVQKNTLRAFHINFTQDIQSLMNIVRQKKVVASLENAKEKPILKK